MNGSGKGWQGGREDGGPVAGWVPGERIQGWHYTCRMFMRKHPGINTRGRERLDQEVGRSPELHEGRRPVLADSTGTHARVARQSGPQINYPGQALYPCLHQSLDRGPSGKRCDGSQSGPVPEGTDRYRLSPVSTGALALHGLDIWAAYHSDSHTQKTPPEPHYMPGVELGAYTIYLISRSSWAPRRGAR